MSPSLRIITFSGFTSRWMIPTLWAWPSAPHTSTAISAAISGKPGVCVARNCFSVWPSMNSVTMYELDDSDARVVEDLEDVLVVQLRDGLGLALEARLRFGLGGQVVVQQLDRDLALERLVLRAIDDRHTTLAHLFDERVPLRYAGLLHPSPSP